MQEASGKKAPLFGNIVHVALFGCVVGSIAALYMNQYRLHERVCLMEEERTHTKRKSLHRRAGKQSVHEGESQESYGNSDGIQKAPDSGCAEGDDEGVLLQTNSASEEGREEERSTPPREDTLHRVEEEEQEATQEETETQTRPNPPDEDGEEEEGPP